MKTLGKTRVRAVVLGCVLGACSEAPERDAMSTGAATGDAAAADNDPDEDAGADPDDGNDDADGPAQTGPGESGTDAAQDDDADGPVDDGSDSAEPMPRGLPELGTLVVLGDSIGDGGGIGPYYYQLLPADLQAHYGSIETILRAESGSVTDALLQQVNGLPDALPGPVAVVITSGGNDMKANILAVVTGADAGFRSEMQANIEAAHAALLAPGRFGPGVDVYIFEGNIYDASDGAGDYGMNGCAFGSGHPVIATDGFFEAWNTAIADTVLDSGQTAVDMHEHFYGHGYHATDSGEDNWYAPDCTHPNTAGHDELRRLFYWHITGESLP